MTGQIGEHDSEDAHQLIWLGPFLLGSLSDCQWSSCWSDHYRYAPLEGAYLFSTKIWTLKDLKRLQSKRSRLKLTYFRRLGVHFSYHFNCHRLIDLIGSIYVWCGPSMNLIWASNSACGLHTLWPPKRNCSANRRSKTCPTRVPLLST